MTTTRLLLPGALLETGEVLVPAAAARHARVARVRPGESVEVLDLAGAVAVGRLRSWRGGACLVDVERVERERGEPPAPLVLALGVVQGAAYDWAVEKATELGVTVLWPVVSGRVQRGNLEARVARWQRVAEAAVTQCGRSRPPMVRPPAPLVQVLEEATGKKFAADVVPPAARTSGGAAVEPGATVLVGPEGGFDDREREAVLSAGFEPLWLGPRILRAETAAVAALVLAQLRLGWLDPTVSPSSASLQG